MPPKPVQVNVEGETHPLSALVENKAYTFLQQNPTASARFCKGCPNGANRNVCGFVHLKSEVIVGVPRPDEPRFFDRVRVPRSDIADTEGLRNHLSGGNPYPTWCTIVPCPHRNMCRYLHRATPSAARSSTGVATAAPPTPVKARVVVPPTPPAVSTTAVAVAAAAPAAPAAPEALAASVSLFHGYENLAELYEVAHDQRVRDEAVKIFTGNWPDTGLQGVPFIWAIFAGARYVKHGQWKHACLFFNWDSCIKEEEHVHLGRHTCFLCGGDHPLHMASDLSEAVPTGCECAKWKALVEEFQRFRTKKQLPSCCLREILRLHRHVPDTPCHDHDAQIRALTEVPTNARASVNAANAANTVSAVNTVTTVTTADTGDAGSTGADSPACEGVASTPASVSVKAFPMPLDELKEFFKNRLNDNLKNTQAHEIVEYTDAPDGDLLVCLCDQCKVTRDDYTHKVQLGLWQYRVAGLPVVDVAVKLLLESDLRGVKQNVDPKQVIGREVRGIKSLYGDGSSTGLVIVAHAFNLLTDSGRTYHFVATALSKNTLSQVFKCKLDDPRRLHMAQALLREANLLLDRDVIHGDVKPANILQGKVNGVWKVSFCDFEFSSVSTRTGATCAAGTRHWASVHQEDDETLSHANDQWSMALVLYEIMHQTRTEHAAVPVFYAQFELSAARQRAKWFDEPTPVPPGTNPWLAHVMRQLFDGKRYDGLLKFEPPELREAVWMLSEGLKKTVLIPGSAWHRLDAALRRMPKFSSSLQPLHSVRNDIVHGRLSVAELYRSEKRRDDIVETTDSAAVLAALDEALLTAGLRVVKNDIGEFDLK